MSLLSDNDVVNSFDLAQIDPESSKIAAQQSPQIILEGDGSIIRSATEEFGNIITSNWQNFSGYLVSPGININAVAAVLNILSTAINRPRMRLNQVVAIEPDPTKRFIKRCMLYKSLQMLYQAAFARFVGGKDHDRFQWKMDHYSDMFDQAFERLKASGIGVVLNPLPCPGAIREFNAGIFDTKNVSTGGSGSTDPGQTWYVVITYLDAAFTDQQGAANNESGPSVPIPVSTTSGQVITVNINGLNPPSSTVPPIGTADGIYTALVPDHFKVYIGSSVQGPFFLQNGQIGTLLSVGTYTLPNSPIQSGTVCGVGQFPDYQFSFQQVLWRA